MRLLQLSSYYNILTLALLTNWLGEVLSIM
jgi:hypothetical protein